MREIFLFLIFSFSSLSATIFVQIDPTTVTRVELSCRFQNRIAVSQGSINQIVYPGCDIEINLDPTMGQVFVYPITEYPQPTSLTVVTDEGTVQDFELTFVDKPAEIVILESCKPFAIDTCLEEECACPDHPEHMVTLVKGIIGGNVPEGYVACDISKKCRKIKQQVRAHLVSKLVSADETIYVWRLENASRRIQRMTEKEANFQKGQWAYLSASSLQKRKSALAIIGIKN